MKTNQTACSMKDLQKTYVARLNELAGDLDGRLRAQAYLNSSTAIYHGDIIGVGFVPKIYDMGTLRFMDETVKTTYNILEKVTKRFIEDAEYRKLFGFSPLLEKLICLPTGYECTIPIMRMDIFLNEESFDFWFCEFNTDGTSGMNEDRESALALKQSHVYQMLEEPLKLESQELFEGWVDEFLRIYQSSEQALSDPCIAIVDFTGSASMNEFKEFKRRFEARGYRCLICDVKDLEYKKGSLYARVEGDAGTEASGSFVKVDAIYRRAVTSEIVAALEQGATEEQGAGALVRAVEERSVCMIGGFITHVAHCKQLFSVLHHPQTVAFLDTAENDFVRAHIPYTASLSSDTVDLDRIKSEKNAWIIKPEDGYGSQGVYAGLDHDLATWAELVDTCSKEHYIVQTFCEQYATPNSRIVPADSNWKPLFADREAWLAAGEDFDPVKLDGWNNLTGMYTYGGKFGGLFMRAGRAGIIAGFAGGITLAAFLSDYDPQAGLSLRTTGSHDDTSSHRQVSPSLSAPKI